MRKLITFIIVMLCISVDLYAQQSTSYHYDAAGNRIKREIIISKKQAVAAPKTKAPSYSDMLSDYQIRIAPNPTKGRVKVSVLNTDAVFDVRVHSSNGQVIVSQSSARNGAEIDLTNQPNGIYILVISLGQEKTTWKIIKTD